MVNTGQRQRSLGPGPDPQETGSCRNQGQRLAALALPCSRLLASWAFARAHGKQGGVPACQGQARGVSGAKVRSPQKGRQTGIVLSSHVDTGELSPSFPLWIQRRGLNCLLKLVT